MGDGNQPPLGFDLGEPDIVTDSYKYYGSNDRNKYRKYNGITLYADGSILDCKWKSNDQIEIGTPVFFLKSIPESDGADVYYLSNMDMRSQCFECVGSQSKKTVGYLVAPTHTLYPAYVSGSIPTVIDMNDSRLSISDAYLFIYGRLYRRSKDNKFFIIRTGFFGNLTNETTATGIQIDDDFVKVGLFRFELGLGVQIELIQGCIYNKDTSDETIFGSSVLEDKSVFWASYNNYKQTQKSNPTHNFKKPKMVYKEFPLKSFESLKPKMIPLPDDDNWSDEEDTKIVRAFAKKHSPTK